MTTECIIEIKHLWTQFGAQVVHRDLNLCVHRGEVLSLVGGSGSGDTLVFELDATGNVTGLMMSAYPMKRIP